MNKEIEDRNKKEALGKGNLKPLSVLGRLVLR
jgi:hypothetical protein